MSARNKIKVLFSSLQLRDSNMDLSQWDTWIIDLDGVHTRSRVGPVSGDKLNQEHTTGEDIQFGGVVWRICQSLRGHVAIGPRAVCLSETRVGPQQPGHAKVGHLGPAAPDQKDIVAAEVTMKHLVTVQVGESLGHVMGNVHLDVERERGRVGRGWPLQEAGQALVH